MQSDNFPLTQTIQYLSKFNTQEQIDNHKTKQQNQRVQQYFDMDHIINQIKGKHQNMSDFIRLFDKKSDLTYEISYKTNSDDVDKEIMDNGNQKGKISFIKYMEDNDKTERQISVLFKKYFKFIDIYKDCYYILNCHINLFNPYQKLLIENNIMIPSIKMLNMDHLFQMYIERKHENIDILDMFTFTVEGKADYEVKLDILNMMPGCLEHDEIIQYFEKHIKGKETPERYIYSFVLNSICSEYKNLRKTIKILNNGPLSIKQAQNVKLRSHQEKINLRDSEYPLFMDDIVSMALDLSQDKKFVLPKDIEIEYISMCIKDNHPVEEIRKVKDIFKLNDDRFNVLMFQFHTGVQTTDDLQKADILVVHPWNLPLNKYLQFRNYMELSDMHKDVDDFSIFQQAFWVGNYEIFIHLLKINNDFQMVLTQEQTNILLQKNFSFSPQICSLIIKTIDEGFLNAFPGLKLQWLLAILIQRQNRFILQDFLVKYHQRLIEENPINMLMYLITIEDLYFIGCSKEVYQSILDKSVDSFTINEQSMTYLTRQVQIHCKFNLFRKVLQKYHGKEQKINKLLQQFILDCIVNDQKTNDELVFMIGSETFNLMYQIMKTDEKFWQNLFQQLKRKGSLLLLKVLICQPEFWDEIIRNPNEIFAFTRLV